MEHTNSDESVKFGTLVDRTQTNFLVESHWRIPGSIRHLGIQNGDLRKHVFLNICKTK